MRSLLEEENPIISLRFSEKKKKKKRKTNLKCETDTCEFWNPEEADEWTSVQ